MNRRQVIQSLGLVSAHALFPAVLSGFVASCASKDQKDLSLEFFSEAELSTVKETIDLIIPPTRTKSASEVNTHLFMDQVFAKCMTPQQQELMRQGLVQLEAGLKTVSDKSEYLVELDKKAFAGDDNLAYFKTLKQYALIGFFTSQEGTTKASNYVKIPDAYKGEVPVTGETLNYGKTRLIYNV